MVIPALGCGPGRQNVRSLEDYINVSPLKLACCAAALLERRATYACYMEGDRGFLLLFPPPPTTSKGTRQD